MLKISIIFSNLTKPKLKNIIFDSWLLTSVRLLIADFTFIWNSSKNKFCLKIMCNQLMITHLLYIPTKHKNKISHFFNL